MKAKSKNCSWSVKVKFVLGLQKGKTKPREKPTNKLSKMVPLDIKFASRFVSDGMVRFHYVYTLNSA